MQLTASIALLVILVPNPDLDYKSTARMVGKKVVAALSATLREGSLT
jgi:hypothetical protein